MCSDSLFTENENTEDERTEPQEMPEAELPHAIHYNGRVYCPQCHGAQPYYEGICQRCGCLFLSPEDIPMPEDDSRETL